MSDCWVQTISGMDVDLLHPKPEQILLGDIVHSLARMARFNGHTIGDIPWSVAQHSVLVESLLPDDADVTTRMHALLHDAHEAYIGDFVSPLFLAVDALCRQEVREENSHTGTPPSSYLKEIATRLDVVIFATFGVRPTQATWAAVKTADMLALRVEADRLMAPRRREWTFLPPPPDPLLVLVPFPAHMAQAYFLNRFDQLQRLRHGLIYEERNQNQWPGG